MRRCFCERARECWSPNCEITCIAASKRSSVTTSGGCPQIGFAVWVPLGDGFYRTGNAAAVEVRWHDDVAQAASAWRIAPRTTAAAIRIALRSRRGYGTNRTRCSRNCKKSCAVAAGEQEARGCARVQVKDAARAHRQRVRVEGEVRAHVADCGPCSCVVPQVRGRARVDCACSTRTGDRERRADRSEERKSTRLNS